MACDNRPLCRRDCRGDAGVTKWSALAADVFLHVTPQDLTGCRIDRGHPGASGFGVQPFTIARIVHIVNGNEYGGTIGGHAKVHATLNTSAP